MSPRILWILILLGLAKPGLADDPTKAKPPEFLEMLGSILVNGSNMGPNSGWFHPSESRYGWHWLLERLDGNKDGLLTRDELKGPALWFRALDRDGDEAITSEDLDWTPSSRYLQSRSQARGRFARMDTNGNGRITLEEWSKAFEQTTKDKGFLTQEDMATFLYPPSPSRTTSATKGQSRDAQGPSRLTLLKGLFSGEIGSFTEGPNINDQAPDFTLETHDTKRTISLSEFRGKKPVVLIFGSFT